MTTNHGKRSRTSTTERRRRYTRRRRAESAFLPPPTECGQDPRSPVEKNDSSMLPSLQRYVESLTSLGKEHFSAVSAEPLRDGSGLGARLPSQHTSEALYSEQPDTKLVTDIFVNCVKKNKLELLVQSIHGTPSKEQVSSLERTLTCAASECQAALATALHCSSRKAHCGAPVRADILRKLILALHDPDTSLADQVDEGVSLGVDHAIPKTGLFPEYTKRKEDEALQLLRLQNLANYTSAEEDPSVTEDIILEEVQKGRMIQLSKAEASDPERVFARMALIKKGHPSPVFFGYDVASAFRNLYVHPSDVHRLCVRVNGKAYQHRALPFGVRLAPFHWCRIAAAVIRILRKLIQCFAPDLPFASLIYVDDGLMAIPPCEHRLILGEVFLPPTFD
ncbi:hypothetical protein FOZ60_005921 [Perkinsus olseni]|uniref:Reverse transcriptase domain-containing protein n=1 Tax=Perkinsus olseni TaxID=32597 RepID=A0A7J6NPY2_PEROL|nr:hypothetical protein FOZ60_005921 [Perkinsus olseni]